MLLRTWLILLLWAALPAGAAEPHRMRLSDGTEIAYMVVLPAGFTNDGAHPALIVFPGGAQTIEHVQGTLSRFWAAEAVRRGYIVFSPAAPAGRSFDDKGADLVPEFLQRLLASYRIEGDRFDVAGHSNGGVSAFAAAVRHPGLFRSLTVLAGFPVDRHDFDRLERLRGLRVSMFVGDRDLGWKEGMERTRDRLAAAGADVRLEVVPGNGHLLPSLSFDRSARIFDAFGDGTGPAR